jgi:3-oxoadipate enol-lactonase
MFDEAATRLSSKYRTLQLDLRGHGQSDSVGTNYTLGDIADDVIALADSLGIEKMAWVGLSMGGMTGMRIAIKRPQLLQAMVLLDTSASTDPGRERYEAWAEKNQNNNPDKKYAQSISGMMVTKDTRAKDAALIERIERMVMENSATGLYHSTLAVIRREDIRPQLRQVKTPTLVVVGEKDIITPRPMAEDIHAGIEGSEFHVEPESGHLCIMEHPDAVTTRIEQFLRNHLN